LQAIFGPFASGVSPILFDALEVFTNKAVSSKLLMFPSLQVDLGPWSPWGRIERIKEQVDREVFAEIARRRSTPEQDDLLGCLLTATGEDGHTLTDSEIRDEILTLVVAGHEITASVLCWLFYAIISRKHVLYGVRQELAAKSTGGQAQVDELVYLDAVMRSARIVLSPTTIRGFDVPAGALVTVAMHLLHRRPEIFADPEQFMPERFLGSKFSPYEYAPFGGGDRRCLGMAIAIHELKTIVATVLDRVDLACSLGSVRPVRRGAFLAPEAGLLVEVRARPKPATVT
jgi:unspecific monooxygenase